MHFPFPPRRCAMRSPYLVPDFLFGQSIALVLAKTFLAGLLAIVPLSCRGGGGEGSTTPTAPSITSQPSSQTVMVGQAATFTVGASGTAPISYQWRRSGSDISGATSTSYTTPATTSADNGATFTVRVSNSAGFVDSQAATLTVTGPPLTISFTQDTVGSRANLVSNGAWWGENISKIVHYGSKTFTYVIDASVTPTKAFLYSKSADGAWTEGEGFEVSRPPNLLVDSAGVIHLIGFAPLDAAANDSDGRLFHVKFAVSGTVSGTYFTEFISEDWRPIPTTTTYSTYFVGAAIGADDTIAVAYNNSVQWDTPNTHTLSFRVRNPQSQTWTYETVAQNMVSRHCYPFACVSPYYFHVYAVEDDHDADYAALGEPYASYPFRYGMVKHFQRPRSGGAWEETTLLNFNGNPGISKAQIWDAMLRITDFHVDAIGIVHALLRYKGTFNGSTLVAGTANKSYHYWKTEGSTTWNNEEILPSQELYWARIWERSDGRLFFIGQTLRDQLWVIPYGETTKYIASSLSGEDMVAPTPFISSLRGGTDLSTSFKAVVFSGKYTVPAKSLDVLVD